MNCCKKSAVYLAVRSAFFPNRGCLLIFHNFLFYVPVGGIKFYPCLRYAWTEVWYVCTFRGKLNLDIPQFFFENFSAMYVCLIWYMVWRLIRTTCTVSPLSVVCFLSVNQDINLISIFVKDFSAFLYVGVI